MRLLMLIVDESRKEELEVFLTGAGVAGYTELAGARGFGTTGRRLGSGAYPKTSAVIFTFVEAERVDELVRLIREYCADCSEQLRAVVWSAETVL